jgi:hypothetical protein
MRVQSPLDRSAFAEIASADGRSGAILGPIDPARGSTTEAIIETGVARRGAP